MKNTRKKILAMILALVMAMAVTASAADTTLDIGPADKGDFYAYTDENCDHAILKVYADNAKGTLNPDGSFISGYIPKPDSDNVDKFAADPKAKETPIGNTRETWDYLLENYGMHIANYWFQAEGWNVYDENPEFPELTWLLTNGNRLFAYVYNRTGYDNAWHWLTRSAMGNQHTDENVLHDYPSKPSTTTPEPTATQPVNNTQTDTAPVTVTPGEVMTVTVNGVPMQLEAVVITDANGGATTYFKLRDVGDAVGFQVDWTAATGITINSK